MSDHYEWLVESECDTLCHIEDEYRSMKPKNSAFIQGVEAAKKYLATTIAITEKEWRLLAEQYASGHLSSPSARRHFEQGWLTIAPATFATEDTVILQVRIMNIYPDQLKAQKQLTPPEKEMYDLFGAWSTIEFVGESKICLTYRIITSCTVVNRHSQFLRRKQISYKIEKVSK